MNLNKLAVVLLSAIMAIGMVSCGSGEFDSESEAESSSQTESEAQLEEVEGSYADGVFETQRYTLTVDENKWEYSEDDDVDCTFSYVGNEEDIAYSTASLNIVSMTSEDFEEQAAEEYAETIEGVYETMDGYEIIDSGSGTLGDYETYCITVSYTTDEMTMTINQVIFSKDQTVITISYGAVDEIIDELQEDFDELMYGFEFK
ncbi:MAG: hypothetical protein LUE12_07920 [Ruminococcus sp.]|nr:hypothetical protein [Ruminococcus sp.]